MALLGGMKGEQHFIIGPVLLRALHPPPGPGHTVGSQRHNPALGGHSMRHS